MPIPTPRLKVYPNPWTYIDHLGRPAGVLPFDFFEHTRAKGWVGAEIVDAKEVRAAPKISIAGQDIEIRPGSHELTFGYSKEAVEIPNTGYYRQHIKAGDLIPADERTARECGYATPKTPEEREIAEKSGRRIFTKPEELLAQAREEAIKRFDAETGEDAYKAFGSKEVVYLEQGGVQPVAAPKAELKNRVADAQKGDK